MADAAIPINVGKETRAIPRKAMKYLLVIWVIILKRAVAFVPSPRAAATVQPRRGTLLTSHSRQDLIVGPLKSAQDVISDDTLAMEAFEWCSNLGAPAALVAGAVLATLSQTRGDLAPSSSDPQWVRFSKKLCRALLLSSFAMEIVCIFVTTVTGTMLLSHGDSPAGMHAGIHYHSAMGFLNHNHEFEYLTSRVTFLQGLLHWLAAVALDVVIPKDGEGAAAKKMNHFISSSLVALILMILSFYNGHMTFYSNYFQMLLRYTVVFMKRYFWRWPPRPMSFLSAPAWIASFVLGWRAFNSPPDDEPEQVQNE